MLWLADPFVGSGQLRRAQANEAMEVPAETRPPAPALSRRRAAREPSAASHAAAARVAQSVQTFGRKKTAVAVSYCKKGRGLIKINGCPIELVQPETLRFKVFEPILLLGRDRFANVDIRIRVKGGGYTAQIYGEHSRL